MNNCCKDIEAKIVDYFEGSMSHSEKSEFLKHINVCWDCKEKYKEFEKAYIFIRIDSKLPVETNTDLLFENISRISKQNRLLFRFAFTAIFIVVFLLSAITFSRFSYQSRLIEAKNFEISVDYVVDIEEELMSTDDETFEIISQMIYGDDYKEFEQVLEETSIIKP